MKPESIPIDPAYAWKCRSPKTSFPGAEVWACGDRVVVDSETPLPELKLREFGRPRIYFEGRCYYVSEKSESSGRPTVYRYVLAGWPKADESITREVHLDEDYFARLRHEGRQARREGLAFRSLVLLYPLLGFLWSPQKRWLNQVGFEAHALSSISVFVGFLAGFSCACFLVVLEWGAKTLPWPLLLGLIGFLTDAIVRYDRLQASQDSVPPGFYEWLLRRSVRFE